jgi:hypothetical protein
LICLRELVHLLFTSNAFRLIISDILGVWREIVADTAEKVAKAAADIELRAEQLARTIRPNFQEPDRHQNTEEIDIPSSLDDLTSRGENAREETYGVMKETAAEAGGLRSNTHDDSPECVKTRVLDRTQQVHFISIGLSPRTD